MRDFLRLWVIGYFSPIRFVNGLSVKAAPHWGFYAQLTRGLLDSLLLYLPLSLMGRIPPTPPYLSFVATDSYYAFLVIITPIVFTAQWLLGGIVIHLLLRLNRRASNFNQILNLTGMVTLVVGSFLLLWDWLWLSLGGMNQYWLGISHLLIDIWAVAIISIGLNKRLLVPLGYAVMAAIVSIAVNLPLAIMFMRSPL